MTTAPERLRNVLRGSAGIAIAMGVMNIATYGYTMVAARTLGPKSFGAFAAVMGLLLVLSVVQLGLQTTGARRIASEPAHVAEIERTLLGVTYRAAFGLGALALVLTPVINIALHLDSLLTSALVALSVWPMTVMGGQAGILQGERRWYPLAVLYMAAGIPRLLIGTGLLLWRPDEAFAILGVTLGSLFPVMIGWIALRRSAVHRSSHDSGTHDVRTVLWETTRNSHALLAFFTLSNADVILARSILDRHDAGLYAGGLILVKAMLFLPQFVVIVAFPSMSNEAERRDALLRGIAVVLGLGVVGVLAAWLLSSVALVFIGGPLYSDIQGKLWIFAILGTLLSAIQLLVYSVVARQSQKSVYLIWLMLALLVVGATQVSSVGGMLTVVCLVDGALFLILLGISLWRIRTAPALDAEKATSRP